MIKNWGSIGWLGFFDQQHYSSHGYSPDEIKRDTDLPSPAAPTNSNQSECCHWQILTKVSFTQDFPGIKTISVGVWPFFPEQSPWYLTKFTYWKSSAPGITREVFDLKAHWLLFVDYAHSLLTWPRKDRLPSLQSLIWCGFGGNYTISGWAITLFNSLWIIYKVA